MNDGFDFIDVYLEKDGEIIGLHAVGVAGQYNYTVVDLDGTERQESSNFEIYESWLNKYDSSYKMIGGSHRLHSIDMDRTTQEFIDDGWVVIEKRS